MPTNTCSSQHSLRAPPPEVWEAEAIPQTPAASVTGKNKIKLHSLTLTFASWCFCSLKWYCQYIMSCLGGTPPLLLNVKCKCLWNQSAFVQENILTLSTCCWLLEGRNTHIPFQRLAFPGDICKTYDLFTLLHHLLHFSVLQKKLASRPW